MSRNNTGVFAARKKDNSIYYRASLTYKGKHISLGSFDTEEAAGEAYRYAREILDTPSLLPENCPLELPLPFEKLVILTNFRDNGLYFSTPIYLRKSFFLYYLSRERILKFDKDDLFYYSSHKIMARGNHLFVADYGMQVNILNRYEIMSYAVPGRDYDFANGDTNDFRYNNIIIHNRYRGVRRKDDEGNVFYEAYIHVNGTIKIGNYEREELAAIAYNKAIDILHKNGFKRKYTPNYVENISPREYAELYSSLSVNPYLYEA